MRLRLPAEFSWDQSNVYMCYEVNGSPSTKTAITSALPSFEKKLRKISNLSSDVRSVRGSVIKVVNFISVI